MHSPTPHSPVCATPFLSPQFGAELLDAYATSSAWADYISVLTQMNSQRIHALACTCLLCSGAVEAIQGEADQRRDEYELLCSELRWLDANDQYRAAWLCSDCPVEREEAEMWQWWEERAGAEQGRRAA